MNEAGWRYVKRGVANDETVGPLSELELFRLFARKKVNVKTLVSHPEVTAGQWVPLGQTTTYKKFERHLEERRQEEQERRQRELQEARKSREKRRAELAAEREAARQEDRRERELTRVGTKAQDAAIGKDRWPSLFACSKAYVALAGVIAILFVILAIPPALAITIIALAGFSSFDAGDRISAASFVVAGVAGLFLFAMNGYLIYVTLRALSEVLVCLASIEANTRPRSEEEHER